MKQNLLYGISKHLKVNACVSVNQVLLVPLPLRRSVFELAHDPNTGGHIATKTTDKVLSNFYLPSVHDDIYRFCRSCFICQKTSPLGLVPKLPGPCLPILDVPFERVAVDIVGHMHPATEKEGA